MEKVDSGHHRLWRHALAAIGLSIAICPSVLGSPTCPPDYDNNGLVEPADIAAFIQAWTNSLNQGTLEADYDHNGVVEPVDISVFVAQWNALVNAGGCPPSITLSVSPTSGSIGTPITLSLSPANAPNAFDSNSTASWTGRYVPTVGSPTSVFTVSFSSADVQETSGSQAVILLGSGTCSLPTGIENLGPGIFDGVITANLTGGATPASAVTISCETDAATWESVHYPDGPGGLGSPTIGGALTSPPIMRLGVTHPDPQHPAAATLMGSNAFHLAAVLRISENAASATSAPSTVSVDLVTYDSSGAETDRYRGLVLNKILSDGDPSHITYSNDLLKPIIIVDTAIDRSAYPNFVLLRGTSGGSAVVVPGT
ncbi:MAG: hypothetical protein KF745_07980 [Phycisphaeraceae bacterium]|nr:hypothetical protein [Phycisphaeraceae bacterium]